MTVTRERRRAARHASDPHYDAFTDRRQPPGVVASWVRIHGGELCRARVHYLHLARVLAAKLQRVGTLEWHPAACAMNLRVVPWEKPRVAPVATSGAVTWAGKRPA